MSLWRILFGKKKRSSYSKGMSAEKRIKAKLESKGWLVRQSKGSRGPYDLYAIKSGRKLLVQVKSGTASMSRKEARKLRYVARSKGAKGLVISVKGRKIKSRFVY
jgi:predicted transcriptional regulator